jgi:hypothetical protein
MRNDSSGNDPRKLWQGQPTEPSTMTLERMRQKTQELHAKTRRALLGWMITPLLVAVLSGSIILQIHLQIHSGPVLHAVFAVAIAWSLAGPYFVSRGMWSATLPGGEAFNTGLESYRREVERRRSLSSRFLLWCLGPVALSLAALIASLLSVAIGKGMLLNMIPFAAVVVVWIVSVFVIRLRDRRELQREIDELNQIQQS